MKDGIIKGEGNSRYIKSVANFLSLYPDYNSFAQALIAGTLPIDINGINAEGWTQIGTALNKANLVSDETAAMLGLTVEDPTVNEALSHLGAIKVKMVIGTYTGTGTWGEENPVVLELGFRPRFLLVWSTGFTIWFEGMDTMRTCELTTASDTNIGTAYVTVTETGISWYATEIMEGSAGQVQARAQLNNSGILYGYLALT